MAHEFEHPYIGQQALVGNPGGQRKAFIGTVVDWEDNFPQCNIQVRHPITGVVSHYDPRNVVLVPISVVKEGN